MNQVENQVQQVEYKRAVAQPAPRTEKVNAVLDQELKVFRDRVIERLEEPVKTMTSRKLKKIYPDLPSKNKSSYIYFFNKNRVELAEKKMGFNEIAKTLGTRWRALSPEDKKEYEQSAVLDRQRYAVEIAEFNGKHPEHQIKSKIVRV
jgi:hypothetical protein